MVGIFLLTFGHAAAEAEEPVTLRIGFFPNLTHGQALYLQSNEGGGGAATPDLNLAWTLFTAGPTAIEALLTNEIDASYIGPNPAVNGFMKSHGEKFVIVAGAAIGGAGLVVRDDSGIKSERDFNGKTVATPQLGNTQDVAARSWFSKKEYKLKDVGGTVTLIPIAPADQLNLFKRKDLDAAWTVEPWLSRLEIEAGGRLLVDEKDLWPNGRYMTTCLVVSREFMKDHPAALRSLLQKHIAATQAINADVSAAQKIINGQLKKITGTALSEAVITRALTRIKFDWDPVAESVNESAQAAFRIGFLRTAPKLDKLFELAVLNSVLAEKGLSGVAGLP